MGSVSRMARVYALVYLGLNSHTLTVDAYASNIMKALLFFLYMAKYVAHALATHLFKLLCSSDSTISITCVHIPSSSTAFCQHSRISRSVK